MAGQDTDGAENGGGGTDGQMACFQKNGIDEVSENTGKQYHKPAQAPAHDAAHRSTEYCDTGHVSQKMDRIGMKHQCGDDPVKFALQNGVGSGPVCVNKQLSPGTGQIRNIPGAQNNRKPYTGICFLKFFPVGIFR